MALVLALSLIVRVRVKSGLPANTWILNFAAFRTSNSDRIQREYLFCLPLLFFYFILLKQFYSARLFRLLRFQGLTFDVTL